MTDKSESLKQQLQDALYEIDKLREENAQLKQSATPPISSPVIKPKVKVHQSASTPDVKKEYDRLKPVYEVIRNNMRKMRETHSISDSSKNIL